MAMVAGAMGEAMAGGLSSAIDRDQLDVILRAVGRLMQDQAARLDDLYSNHAALAEALAALQFLHKDAAALPVAPRTPPSAKFAAGVEQDDEEMMPLPEQVQRGRPLASNPVTMVPDSRDHTPPPPLVDPGAGRWESLHSHEHRARPSNPPSRMPSNGRASSVPAPGIAPMSNGANRRTPVEPSGGGAMANSHGPEGLNASALAVLAEAHSQGLALRDLEALGEAEWADLGASPADRDTILGAAAARRQRQMDQLGRGGGGRKDAAAHRPCVMDHLQGGMAEGDAPGSHGHAKDMDFVGGLERGIGHGRRSNIGMKDHIFPGTAVGDGPGAHGRSRAQDFQGGLQRGIGHGKYHIAPKNHIRHGVADSEPPGTHGNIRDEGTEPGTGLPRGIGHGRHFIGSKDHIIGGSTCKGDNLDDIHRDRRHYVGAEDHIHAGSAADDAPGAHGHGKDGSFQDGLPRGMGHGKHHIQVRDHIRGGTAIPDKEEYVGRRHVDSYEDQVRAMAAASPSRPNSTGAAAHLSRCLDAAVAAGRPAGVASSAGGSSPVSVTSMPRTCW